MKCVVIISVLIAWIHSSVQSKRNLAYDESKSAALIEDIDAIRVSRGTSFDTGEDHGHDGLEYVDPDEISRSASEWVVQISGGERAVAVLAENMGYENVGKVPGLEDFYLLKKSEGVRLRKQRNEPPTMRHLADDTKVIWAEQQYGKIRQKRGYLPAGWDESDRPLIREKRVADQMNTEQPRRPPQLPYRFSDPLWDHQWYLQDTRSLPSLPRIDLNVIPVYDMGITGRGVTVVVLDDGIEFNHTDLAVNYDAEVSYDINNNDPDPSPRYGNGMLNSHGTRCAGEIAMVANNGKCGVGVAYNVRIGGIRMLDGTVSDRVEATSLTYALDKVDIYSASWGPSDDGRTVEGPGKLTRQALYRGVTEGRKGRGAIYIWAAGNGGRRGDNCNVDGYVSSVYTLSVGSVTEQGSFPWYGEECASNMAVTYSSGAYYDQKIATTDLNDQCTMDHTGTSAAAPLAAGIVALALEANPTLTWRDVIHITAWTADPSPLERNSGWKENAAGFRCNTRFGFGLMNGDKFVRTAVNWTQVPDKKICVVSSSIPDSNMTVTNETPARVIFQSNGCQGSDDQVNYLEHVEVVITLQYPTRGLLEINLISPSGTQTQVLKPRAKDSSSMGFINWPFMSVHTWGENPYGQWKLQVVDKVSKKGTSLTGQVVNATLILHGTSVMPEYRKTRKVYDDSFNTFPEQDLDRRQQMPVDVDELRSKNPDLTWNDLVGLKLSR